MYHIIFNVILALSVIVNIIVSYILVRVRNYIKELQESYDLHLSYTLPHIYNKAIADEDYSLAQRCHKLMQELKIINTKNN